MAVIAGREGPLDDAKVGKICELNNRKDVFFCSSFAERRLRADLRPAPPPANSTAIICHRRQPSNDFLLTFLVFWFDTKANPRPNNVEFWPTQHVVLADATRCSAKDNVPRLRENRSKRTEGKFASEKRKIQNH